uniref:MIF4G domain-containing protein n=1 Tax=Cricetulus griseus TaxID=10029 RepID=A0A8C2MFQ2_CRIGR
RSGALPEQMTPQRAPPKSAMAEPQVVVAPVLMSKLSADAPEFYPSGYSNYTESYEDGCEDCPTLSEYVQDFPNHLTEQPGSFETEIEQFAETLNGWVTTDNALQELVELIYQQATSISNCSYMGAHLPSCRRRQSDSKNDFILLLQEEIFFRLALRELGNALFSNPKDANLICAVKLLKLTGSLLEVTWKERGKTDVEEVIQRIENVLDANCSRDVKLVLLKLVQVQSSNWGRVHAMSRNREATPENDLNYFMNEPTFYTSDGVPFTAADPDYQEKYQELLEREDFFPDNEANETDLSRACDPYLDDTDGEMDPETEEAYEKFCLE